MAKILIYNQDTNRMETFYRGENEAMPYNANRTLKVKEILDMTSEELRKMMSGDQIDRMLDMGIEHVWKLLEFLQDGVRAAQESSDLKDDDDYVTIDEYLDYLEEMSSED